MGAEREWGDGGEAVGQWGSKTVGQEEHLLAPCVFISKFLLRRNYSPCHFEVRCLHREISFKHCEISRFARNDTVAE
jgi:hypothetical protein